MFRSQFSESDKVDPHQKFPAWKIYMKNGNCSRDKKTRTYGLRWLLIWLFPGLLLFAQTRFATAESETKTVSVTQLQNLYLFPLKNAPAKTVSLNDARVSAEITGIVSGIKVNVGDAVKEGEPIALLDCQEHETNLNRMRAMLDAAQAELVFSKSQFESGAALSSKKSMSQEQVSKRRSEYTVARAEVAGVMADLKNAERAVERCEIKAPFSGVVLERIASTGDYAVAGSHIVRLLDNENIEVSANIQEQDIASLKEANEIIFLSREKRFSVSLRTILPIMESKLRSFEARFLFIDEKAPPGSTGRLEWKHGGPFISSEFLVHRDNSLGIFINSDGTAKFISVPDAKLGQPVQVNLSGTTSLILDGRQTLTEGDPVKAIETDNR